MCHDAATSGCLVLGANSGVGRMLAAAISKARPKNTRFIWQTRHACAAPHPDWAVWDFRAPETMPQNMGQVDTVLCLAGVTGDRAAKEPDLNTELALGALETARRVGARQVFLASTVAVYGRPPDGATLRETDPAIPASAYGKSKRGMERAVLAKATADKPIGVSCLRIGNVAGADQLFRNAARLTKGRPLVLDQFPDGRTPRRAYIGPQTLARVLLCLLECVRHGTNLPDLLNVAAPGVVEMSDLLAAIGATRPIHWKTRPAPDSAVPEVQLELTRLEALCGFSPADSTAQEMVRQVLACEGASK